MFCWTAAPMTAWGTREGEPSPSSMRNGLGPQPARLVRGSSRRIMAMRFRPANIRVINRRASSLDCHRPCCPEMLRAHQQERVPATPPVKDAQGCQNGARGQGSTSPRQTRPCPLRAVPTTVLCDGRLRREHFTVCLGKAQKERADFPPCGGKSAGFEKHTVRPRRA